MDRPCNRTLFFLNIVLIAILTAALGGAQALLLLALAATPVALAVIVKLTTVSRYEPATAPRPVPSRDIRRAA